MVASAGRTLKAVVGLVHRLAYSILIGLITYLLANLPLYEKGEPISIGAHVLVLVLYFLDFPIAVVSRLDIPYLAGIDLFFGHGVGEFMSPLEVLTWHLRLTILVYVPLFYLPKLLRAGVERWRQRSRGVPPPSGSGGEKVP
jgi:hypothetical protein